MTLNTDPAPQNPPSQHADDSWPPEVLEAYQGLLSLIDDGWRFTNLDFDAHIVTAFVTAQTPTGRVATVTWDLRGNSRRGWRQQIPTRRPALRMLKLARSVALLGLRDAESGDDYLEVLRWLGSGTTSGSARTNWWRSEHLPGLPLENQPSPPTRAAAWLIATLTTRYGWSVGHLGEEIAGGGFIADIPGDVMAIFPANMGDDGTPAATLAAIIPTLRRQDLAVLRRLNYNALGAADLNRRRGRW